MKTTALLFDLDGTLIDSREDIAASANHLRMQRGREPLSLEVVGSYIGDGIEALVRRVMDLGPGADVAADTDLFRRYYHDHCVEKTFAYDGVAETLALLASRSYRMAVVTNKPEKISVRILEILGLLPHFAAVIGGNSTPFKKPRPEPLYAACDRLGTAKEAAWMVGDSSIDVQAARSAGIPCAGILGGIGEEAALKASAPALILPRFHALLDYFPPVQQS